MCATCGACRRVLHVYCRRLVEFQHYKSSLEGAQGLWRQARGLRTNYIEGKVIIACANR